MLGYCCAAHRAEVEVQAPLLGTVEDFSMGIVWEEIQSNAQFFFKQF